MKQYSVTAAAVLTMLACTQGHAQTLDATLPVSEVIPQVSDIQYVNNHTVVASTDTQYVPNLQIKPIGKKEKVTAEKPVLPVRVDADKMHYTDTTGLVWARGNVEVGRGNQQLSVEKLE